jgi:D-alanyl-D-alanine carboxypeptidase/D-alanyl-D-alanine-endopeptidase (penicillin-binding protein 4)
VPRALRVAVIACAACAALAAVGAGSADRASAPLATRLARALALSGVDQSRSGAVAVDLRTGAVVFARNPSRPLSPASVEKLTVTYAALVGLGAGFRFHTDLLGRGAEVGSGWRGDLILRGYGDPTLGDGDLRRLAKSLRASGVRVVTGRILGDESFFDSRRTAPGWKPSFYLNECPALSALTVDRSAYRGRATPKPAAAAAAAFKRALGDVGVTVKGRATATRVAAEDATPITSVTSAPLWKVLRRMDRESDNFTAEMLLKELGAVLGKRGSTGAGAAVVRNLLSQDGVPLEGVRIVDGSGLSLLDHLTARAVAALLASAWDQPELRRALLGMLPIAGRTGTLSYRMTRGVARGHVVAKTGTTSRASALAGFARGRYAFAVINNGSPVNTWRARLAQDRFATVLASAA